MRVFTGLVWSGIDENYAAAQLLEQPTECWYDHATHAVSEQDNRLVSRYSNNCF